MGHFAFVIEIDEGKDVISSWCTFKPLNQIANEMDSEQYTKPWWASSSVLNGGIESSVLLLGNSYEN